jgi:hypothetical protein
MFNRGEYLSQTQVLKAYKVNAKAYQDLLQQHNIPVVSNHAQMEGYKVTTRYVLKIDVEKLNLQLRHPA